MKMRKEIFMDETIRILIVDDQESFWKPVKQHLVREGFEVEMAATSDEMLAIVKMSRGNFHVVVIGVMNSTEIMLQLRRSYPAIEVIILTNWESMEPGKKVMELGAWYMRKPVNIENLAYDIRHAVQFSQERQKTLALQTLVEAGQRISASQNEEDLYLQLYEEARKLLPSLDGFLISQYAEQDGDVSFPFSYRKGKRVTISSRKNGNKITEFVLRNKEPVLLINGDKSFREEHHLDLPDSSLGYCTSEIAAPMFFNGKIVGTINALTYEPDIHYSHEHIQILQAFANQAAMAIRNVQQLEEARQLRNAAMMLAEKSGKEEVLQTIVEEAHKLIASEYTGLIIQEEDGTLHKVKPVIPETYFDWFDEPRQQGGVTRYVVESRQPKVIPDTHTESLVKESVQSIGIRSMLALPLIHADRVLGVLYAHTFSHRSFNTHDVLLWTAFATQAAATLSNAQEEERHTQDYVRLADELGKLNEKMEFNETMTRVATAAKTIFGSDTCRLAFVDPCTSQIVDWAWADEDPEQFRYESEPRPDGITYYVLRTKQPVFHTVDAIENPQPVPELVSKGLKSFASLPLIYGGRTIGVLHCNYLTKQRPFDEHLKTLMEAFGARAAIALGRVHRDKVIESWRILDRQAITSEDYMTSYQDFVETARITLRASFAAFYPSSLITNLRKSSPVNVECISVGKPPTDWNVLNYCQRDELIREIGPIQNSLLIINDLESTQEKDYRGLKKMGTIRAFVAMHLNVTLQEWTDSQVAGLLILVYREKTAFESNDLAGLQYVGNQLEAGILRKNLQIALQDVVLKRNQQFRSIIHTLKAFLHDGKGLSLDFIAERSLEILGIDSCSLMEYDSVKTRFVQRGTAGLKFPNAPYTINNDEAFKDRFMGLVDSIEIGDIQQDTLLLGSEHVKREGIQSVIIFPLRVDEEFLGLFFANYRKPRDFSSEEKETIGLFADLAALVLHESRLGAELSETQKRLDRHLILVWVSMLENTWRHSIVQKAAAIRNYAAVLIKQLDQLLEIHPAMRNVPATIDTIDKLANDIANAPPRVPQSWEMVAEPIPLGSLLKDVAEREGKTPSLQTGPLINIQTDVDALGNVQISGYRRWMIYALDALIQNARGAMPKGGGITITGSCKRKWVEIRIEDTGNGVPNAIRRTLFKDITPKDKDANGMGIGGLLVATIIEEHGGTIELERPGPGNTTVLIRLPMAGENQ
jgi:GAF domain-containing protein/CheY-like chemotaxis protein